MGILMVPLPEEFDGLLEESGDSGRDFRRAPSHDLVFVGIEIEAEMQGDDRIQMPMESFAVISLELVRSDCRGRGRRWRCGLRPMPAITDYEAVVPAREV